MLADIDNSECDLAVTALECTFSKTLILKSDSGHEAKVHKIISTKNFPGCPAKQTAMGENRRQVNIELVGKEGQSI